MNAGGKVASDKARRACGKDFVKIVKLRRGPGMVTMESSQCTGKSWAYAEY